LLSKFANSAENTLSVFTRCPDDFLDTLISFLFLSLDHDKPEILLAATSAIDVVNIELLTLVLEFIYVLCTTSTILTSRFAKFPKLMSFLLFLLKGSRADKPFQTVRSTDVYISKTSNILNLLIIQNGFSSVGAYCDLMSDSFYDDFVADVLCSNAHLMYNSLR
jgi:hypothetical protein